MKIEIVLFHGFDELDGIAPFEVLQNAAATGANVRVELVTLDGASEIVAAHGLHVHVHVQLSIETPPDLLIVPGGGWVNRAPQGVWYEVKQGALPSAIARVHQAGTTVAAVCTGSMLLTAAGLTKGRSATTHHRALEELRASGAEIVVARVVDDGDLITSGGVTSGIDLALWLVERYWGAQTALTVERQLEYERRGTVWRQSA